MPPIIINEKITNYKKLTLQLKQMCKSEYKKDSILVHTTNKIDYNEVD